MNVTVNVNNLYAYSGSLASLQAGIAGTSLFYKTSSPKSGTIDDNCGVLSYNKNTPTKISISGGSTQELTYLGSGTASILRLLGIDLFIRPVVIFSIGIPAQIYIYAPKAFPPFRGLLVNFNININANYTLAVPSNGDVVRLDSGENMPLEYQGAQVDRITNNADKIFGNSGNDAIRAFTCKDGVFGGAGNDSVFSSAENDVLRGDLGNAILFGGHGKDVFFGGAENDFLNSDYGDAKLFGGSGDEVLWDGAGRDTLTGVRGADVFVANGDADLVTDFDTMSGIHENDLTNNDNVDLAQFYNATTLAAWNAANPTNQFTKPLQLLRFDQSKIGILNWASSLQIQYGGVAADDFVLDVKNTGVICFATGTRITTPKGMVAVEDLSIGDLVLTYDNGFKSIRWIGCRKLAHVELQRNDTLLPVRIRAGALGNGLPERDLVMTRQHRVLVRSPVAETMFGSHEVLIPAKDLRDLDGIETMSMSKGIEYWHILFDEHQLIFSESTPSESFFLGRQAVLMVGQAAREELQLLFPEFEKVCASLARFEVRDHKARQFVKDVSSKNKTLIDQPDFQTITSKVRFPTLRKEVFK